MPTTKSTTFNESHSPHVIAVAGVGSIGKRHIANIRKILPNAKIIALRHKKPDAGESNPEVDIEVFSTEDVIKHNPIAAIISSPAPFHMELATRLADEGIHLLVEKPISSTMDGVAELIDLCRRKNLVLMTAYILRFNSGLKELRRIVKNGTIGRVLSGRVEAGQYLPSWRPGSDYRQTVTAQKKLGGGVLLELSHEIDYLRWILGEVHAVNARALKLSELEIDVDDTAEIILEFIENNDREFLTSGALVSVHLNMIKDPPVRQCRFFGTKGEVFYDFIKESLTVYTQETGEWQDVEIDRLEDKNQMYVEEIEHFLDCVFQGKSPAITGEDGMKALEIVLAAKKSSDNGVTVKINTH